MSICTASSSEGCLRFLLYRKLDAVSTSLNGIAESNSYLSVSFMMELTLQSSEERKCCEVIEGPRARGSALAEGSRRREHVYEMDKSVLGACFAVLSRAKMLERLCKIAKHSHIKCLLSQWAAECVWLGCGLLCSPVAQTQALWRGP